jgi:hypothetical protein
MVLGKVPVNELFSSMKLRRRLNGSTSGNTPPVNTPLIITYSRRSNAAASASFQTITY